MADKFPRVVRSVTVVDEEPGSGGRVVYRRRGRKKDGTDGAKQLEKLVRRVVRAQESFASTYLSSHDKSNRRRSNGWLRDLVSNTARAIDPAMRKITD